MSSIHARPSLVPEMRHKQTLHTGHQEDICNTKHTKGHSKSEAEPNVLNNKLSCLKTEFPKHFKS